MEKGVIVEKQKDKTLTLLDCFKKWSGSPLGKNLNRATDKITKHNYDLVYCQKFKNLKNSKIDFLEVGVCRGGSLACWADYFINAKSITGIDLNEVDSDGISNLIYQNYDDKIKIFNCVDSTAKQQIKELFKNQNFDVIVDDGSHNCHDQIKTFDNLFPFLKSGGQYIIEDIEGYDSLEMLFDHILANVHGCSIEFYDLRNVKQRWDDIIVWINKK